MSGQTEEFHTSLTPSHHVLLRQKKETVGVGRGREWWKVHNPIRDNCAEFLWPDGGRHSCNQPVLRAFTGPYPSFNHQQTQDRRNVAPFYVGSPTSVPRPQQGWQAIAIHNTQDFSIRYHDLSLWYEYRYEVHWYAHALMVYRRTNAYRSTYSSACFLQWPPPPPPHTFCIHSASYNCTR